MVQRVLRVTKDTFFKLRPEQALALTPQEVYPVSEGKTYEILSYAYADTNGTFNGHIKFALKDSSIRGFNTWFIYSPHAQVEFDGTVVYPHEDQEMILMLHINRDTALKRRPLDSSVLGANETYSIGQGRSFMLHSYAYSDSQGDFANHIKFAFRHPQDYVQGLSTWFVYDRHAYIELDDEIVYPPENPDMPILRITGSTVFKRRPVSSISLPASDQYAVSKGETWKLNSYAYADSMGSFNGHIKFTLEYVKDFIRNYNTWYVYEGHAQVEIRGKVVYPIPSTPPPKPTDPPAYTGKSFRLPGYTSTFYTDQPIIAGGNFTWGEATKNATRIPDRKQYVDNILALARQLQRARDQIGRPFQINSWYRPPAVNSAVGGASRSQHLYGSAADIQVQGYSGRTVANMVLPWWNGGIGIYSNIPNVVHLDIGPRRYWGF